MARASWKLCSMSGLHTPSASFSRGLSSASPSSSLPPLGEGAGTHSADVVGRRKGDHRTGGGRSGLGGDEGRREGGGCREWARLYEIHRCDNEYDDDGLDVPEQSWESKKRMIKIGMVLSKEEVSQIQIYPGNFFQ